jgi:ABC-type multidrug transport system fused ATPase/permease subunit
MIGQIFTMLSMAICIYYRLQEDPILIAMSLQNIGRLNDITKHMIHSLGNLTEVMTKVQRLFNMLEIKTEKAAEEHPVKDKDLEERDWPSQPSISFKDVELRYRPKCDLVLKGLNFDIQSGHKVGIVGRTGAGKSTISLALTRIIEL